MSQSADLISHSLVLASFAPMADDGPKKLSNTALTNAQEDTQVNEQTSSQVNSHDSSMGNYLDSTQPLSDDDFDSVFCSLSRSRKDPRCRGSECDDGFESASAAFQAGVDLLALAVAVGSAAPANPPTSAPPAPISDSAAPTPLPDSQAISFNPRRSTFATFSSHQAGFAEAITL